MNVLRSLPRWEKGNPGPILGHSLVCRRARMRVWALGRTGFQTGSSSAQSKFSFSFLFKYARHSNPAQAMDGAWCTRVRYARVGHGPIFLSGLFCAVKKFNLFSVFLDLVLF
jgi:hypothetical protein